MRWKHSLALVCIASATPAFRNLPAQEPPAPKPQAAPAPRPEVHRVAKGAFRVEASLTGVLEAEQKSEVVLRPEVWTSFIVETAVEPGARVKKGEPLLVFRADKLDEEIQELRAAIELGRSGLDLAGDEHRWLRETASLDLAAALRGKQEADEDLKRFLEIDGPLTERLSRDAVKNAQFAVEYSSEELRQLEKMYRADDLTSDTEEIILTRARREVEQSRFNLEVATIRNEETLKKQLPRRKESVTEAARRQAIAFEKATTGLPKQEAKKRLEVLKQRSDLEKQERRLEKLLGDRERLTVSSPQEGMVYYGRFSRGKWLDAAALMEELKPGNTVQVPKVVMTVVEPRPLWVRCDVAEKDLSLVRPGVVGRAAAASLPGVKLPARVERVSPAPVAPGIFDARVAVELSEEAKGLLPGMECSLKLVGYESPQALTLPPAVVFTDEGADERPYVHRLDRDGKPEKRPLKLGRRNEGRVEVLDGLAEGDEVLLKKPEGEGR